MATYEPRDPDFGARVRRDFAAQGAMRLLGASLTLVQPGVVAIEFARRDELAQQHGFIHAGILATALDSACGFAALTLMPPASSVVSVEFKINLLRLATGELFRAVATVRR